MHPPLEWDTWIYRIVVGSLALVVLSVVVGAMILTAYRLGPIPDVITALGSTALGAIAGLLAPSPASKK